MTMMIRGCIFSFGHTSAPLARIQAFSGENPRLIRLFKEYAKVSISVCNSVNGGSDGAGANLTRCVIGPSVPDQYC